MIWFLEGTASQREVLLGVREALPADIPVYASHRQERLEIFAAADAAWIEPQEPNIDWVLATAKEKQVKVVHVSQSNRYYEPFRAQFDAEGIRLVSGALSVETLQTLHSKYAFYLAAEAAGLPVVKTYLIDSVLVLEQVYQEFLQEQKKACLKPEKGIFGHGFWILDQQVEYFHHLAHNDTRNIQPEVFFEAYAQAKKPPKIVMMPYLPGSECSIDMVCREGVVLAAVVRRKMGTIQQVESWGREYEIACAAAQYFTCDGIVNIQTKQDEQGVPWLLEINARYSGGIGYTRCLGMNLSGIFAQNAFDLPVTPGNLRSSVIRPVTIAYPLM